MSKKARRTRVAKWLASLEDDQFVRSALECSIGRVIVNDENLSPEHFVEQVAMIADWIRAERDRDADWLRNVDSAGRPKKLLKFSKYDDIEREIAKSERRRDGQVCKRQLTPKDEVLVTELSDGYHLVRLLSSEAMERESGVLQNCMRRPRMLELLHAGWLFYVLRDRSSKSHVVFRIRASDNVVVEMAGKQNAPPKIEYVKRFAGWMVKAGHGFRNEWARGYVVAKGGEVIPVTQLPDEVILDANVLIQDCASVRLPPILKVSGSITIVNSTLEGVGGFIEATSLFVSKSSGDRIAGTIYTHGQVTVKPDARFAELANEMYVNGDLILPNNNHVVRMPALLRVQGALLARGTRFEGLEEDTQVLGALDLQDAACECAQALDHRRNPVFVGDIVEIANVVKGIKSVNEAELGVVSRIERHAVHVEFVKVDLIQSASYSSSTLLKLSRMRNGEGLHHQVEGVDIVVGTPGSIVEERPKGMRVLYDGLSHDDWSWDGAAG